MQDGIFAWASALQDATRDVLTQVIAYIPQLAGALLLLLLGWLAARFTRMILVRGTGAVTAGINRLVPKNFALRLTPSEQAMGVVGQVGFWAVLLLFVTAAAEAAALPILSAWLDQIVAFMPRALAAGVVLLVGYVLSSVARDAVTAPLSAAGISQARFVGVVVQATVLAASVIIGVAQIGVDVTFLTIVTAIALGSVLVSFAIAFALGARDLVANLIGIQQMRGRFVIGQAIRLDGTEGEILEFSAAAVVLDTPDGTMTIPGQRYSAVSTLLLPPRSAGDAPTTGESS
ncbi:CmpX [Candidatus Phaeomarinobacter ectocarpi]|uniref:Small-conductance mechanosensitive channel n=1 Tax=Candidatus Phaeomarinibacter ectocarpi TaxID=1458461 RepID=X5M6Q1_9HYPH|nr:hypothetical protein [Candidatus Phaeomarinobacter ectocarpi]CDO58718.1 CmpX [Candidatus Phaeomarinobacter ectocarpi]